MNKHIIVGISGGVDSSVAAYLLLEQGYRVEGLFMKNWEEDDAKGYCAAEEDLRDAQQVCNRLGIPLHTVNFSAEYWDRVFAYFLDEYRSGRTPNPDIMCNKEIKFKAFLDYALDLGADTIATGHYVGSRRQGEHVQLLKGADEHKDQSYFLYALNQHALRHSVFPLAHLEKKAVRQIAQTQGFANAEKKDSTGICFIGERKFRDFLQRYLPAQPGDIISTDGTVIGQHQGLMYYTLGQRQGLGIGGLKNAAEAPWFVVDKHLETNQLVVAQGHQNNWLMKQQLQASQLHWISGLSPAQEFACSAKIRYRQATQACQVTLTAEKQCTVCFPQAQRAITPGQSIVFYKGDVCLGGGIIDKMQRDCAD